MAGKSRSVSFVLAYLVKECGMTLQEALKYVQKRRYIYPNIGFIEQLMNYEKSVNSLSNSTLDYDDYIITYTTSMFSLSQDIIKETYLNSNKDINIFIDKLFILQAKDKHLNQP